MPREVGGAIVVHLEGLYPHLKIDGKIKSIVVEVSGRNDFSGGSRDGLFEAFSDELPLCFCDAFFIARVADGARISSGKRGKIVSVSRARAGE